MADNRVIAEEVLKAVGGRENITNATHCMTRLRLNLVDDTVPKDEVVKKIAGVLGVARSGGQYQVIIGQYVSSGLVAFGNVGGFIAVAVIAALWEFLVMSGMHVVMVVTVLNVYMTTGSEGVIWPAALCATAATFGLALGAFLRMKDKEEKSLALGYFISGIIGGVTEPALYGIGLKYKRPLICLMAGGAIGGLYVGLTHTIMYALGATNFLMVLAFSGGSTANFINGCVGAVISILATAALTYLFGFDKNDPVVKG